MNDRKRTDWPSFGMGMAVGSTVVYLAVVVVNLLGGWLA